MEWAVEALEYTLLYFGQYGESLLRLVLAAALGGIIGLEREASAKPAGFRTNLLICVGAALLTDLSSFIARDALVGGVRGDPGRIAAQIVSGIGFLGAGTILQSRGNIIGLTTAATLWVVAAIGMAVGAGAYAQAVTGTLLVMLALVSLTRIEERLVQRRPAQRSIRVVLEQNPELVSRLEQQLMDAGYHVASVDVEKTTDAIVAVYTTRAARGEYADALRLLLADAGTRTVTLS